MKQERLTIQAKRAMQIAEKQARSSGQSDMGTEHVLLGLLGEREGVAAMVLREFGVEKAKLEELIAKLITPPPVACLPKKLEMTPRLEAVLWESEQMAGLFQSELVGTEHLLLAILRATECVATRLLHTMGVDVQKLYGEVLAAMGEADRYSQEDLQSGRAMRDIQSEDTPVLDQYSRDLTALAAQGKLDPVIGREEEISRMIQILSRRTKNNPCLIGEPGVGKTAIAEGLAQMIARDTAPGPVKGKRVVVLDLPGMVAGTKYRGEFEERINKVVKEAGENRNILLFIDELHTIIGAGGAEGALDASNILKPALSRGEIQVIGATTVEEYRKYIEKDAALERRFQPVYVEEPSEAQAVEILKELRSYYEEHHGVTISDAAIEAAVKMSVRYINDRFLPDKAIDLMDEAAAKVQLQGEVAAGEVQDLEEEIQRLKEDKEEALKDGRMELAVQLQAEQREKEEQKKRLLKKQSQRRRAFLVEEEAVAEVVSGWVKIPVQRLTEGESRRLARLEKELHKRVIGQDEAVKAVAQAVKRGRVGLKDPARPIGSFLFLGPTGVGKTELSKALAEAVFGSEQAMIRVDMSEYMEKHSVSKLIGSPPGYVGYEEGGQFSEKVRRNPYSVILFDEIEKAHPDVFNILLQVLDDGHITDAQGRKVDFKQTILIMTSNAGAQAIVEPKRLGFVSEESAKQDYERMKSGVMEEVRRIFKPEFLNRIDEIMVFHTLTKENIRQIVNILLKKVEARCLEQLGITLKISTAVRNYLAEAGFDSKYGARPLRRAIQSKIEDAMANEILEGHLHSGDTVSVKLKKEQILFTVQEQSER